MRQWQSAHRASAHDARIEAEHRRPSPEEFLRRLAAEERLQSRGKLKVFLGYASGVGKSARMLDEGRRRKVAYPNPPGSQNQRRWQDVEDILAAGTSVITSVNLQFVAETPTT